MLKPFQINTPKYYDDRGFLIDLSISKLKMLKLNFKPQQTLIVESKNGVIRGMHSQRKVKQNKLITVLNGKILDVVVDINVNSKNYGKVKYFNLTNASNKSLFVPDGYLHGYQVLSKRATVCYNIDGIYDQKNQITIHPFDPDLKIKWVKPRQGLISKKDDKGIAFKCLKKYL